MDLGYFVPMVLFVCITYAIKIVVDARVRGRIIDTGGSDELVKTIMRDEDQRRRHSSLRWGIVLVAIGVGFGLIQWFGWREVTPGAIAVLAVAVGIGNLVFFAVARKIA